MEEETRLEEESRTKTEEAFPSADAEEKRDPIEQAVHDEDAILEEEAELETQARKSSFSYRTIVDHTEFLGERFEAEREKRKSWDKLTQLYRKRKVIAAKVSEVRPSPETNTVSIIAKINDDFHVLIRDSEFFTDAAFQKDYFEVDERTKMGRRTDKARACLGAWIPFVIIGMRSDWGENGQVIYTIIGDRLKALKLKQEQYFTGPHAVREQDTVTAEVLSVGENFANLEVLGVECSVRKHEINAFHYVMDCQDELKPGDSLKVVIKRIHRNEDGSIKLNVSGASVGYRQIGENNLKLQRGASYQGIVKFYNHDKGIYTVITEGGASVMVPAANIVGREILYLGDQVTVTVKRLYPNAAFGTAKRS